MGKVLKRILMLLLLGAFVFCGMTILVVRHQYTEGDRYYEDLASQFTLRARPREGGDQAGKMWFPPSSEGASVSSLRHGLKHNSASWGCGLESW